LSVDGNGDYGTGQTHTLRRTEKSIKKPPTGGVYKGILNQARVKCLSKRGAGKGVRVWLIGGGKKSRSFTTRTEESTWRYEPDDPPPKRKKRNPSVG